MTLQKILESSLINDQTDVILRNTRGHWYNDQVLDHSQDQVESFTWQDDNTIYIDLKEV